jgi:hypothetical protein
LLAAVLSVFETRSPRVAAASSMPSNDYFAQDGKHKRDGIAAHQLGVLEVVRREAAVI